MEINMFSSCNDLEFHASKREQLNYCRFETLLRIAVWGLFIFRGGAIYSQCISKTYKPFHISSWRLVLSLLVRTSQRIYY